MSNRDERDVAAAPALDFIRQRVKDDLDSGRVEHAVTRFPPEPNGYLHIGHAKSMCLNFGIQGEFPGAACFLRFDDTNPIKEDTEFVEAIKADVRWMGFDWHERLTHASDYFERLCEHAERLIEKGLAYVDSLSAEDMRTHRGTLTEPGTNSPFRDRSAAENLALFRRMRAGEFAEGEHTLRARIDMASPNINLRDPVMYRIMHTPHQMTGDRWCIYPMYDYTHCMSDAFEGVTHSLCTLEFEDHRPLYDWFVEHAEAPGQPRQIEFSRLNLEYTVMSKRVLARLVADGHVTGWDDPRMPTLVGMRRRGYPARALREFCRRIGITRSDNNVEFEALETCIRDDLNHAAPRALAVLDPLRLVIENYEEGRSEELEVPNHPQRPELGTRRVPFSRTVLIERSDFMEDPPRKFFRLGPGREVRLKYAYYVTCTEVIKDPASGEILELRCRYDPESRGGNTPDGRKIKGTIHWVSEAHALEAEVRLYDRLFTEPDPLAGRHGGEFTERLNPDSLRVVQGARVEPFLADAGAGATFQFERMGYFCADAAPPTGSGDAPVPAVFNRTATLRDTWAKISGA